MTDPYVVASRSQGLLPIRVVGFWPLRRRAECAGSCPRTGENRTCDAGPKIGGTISKISIETQWDDWRRWDPLNY